MMLQSKLIGTPWAAMKSVERLAAEFAEHVAAQTEAIRKGDAKTGNKHARRYIRVFTDLRSIGDAGRNALMPLMYDRRDDVRGIAAAFLLRHCTEEARRVLEELSTGQGMVAFGAAETLKLGM